MRASIDAEGRIIIPPVIRDEVGLEPGTEVDVEVRNGVVQLTPVELPVRLVRRRRLLVAIPNAPIDPMTTSEINEVRDALLGESLDGS